MSLLEDDSSAMATGVRSLLLAGIAAALVQATAIAWAGALEPGYSHLRQFVSELGAVGASHQQAFNYGGLVLSGLLTVLFSLGLALRLKPRGLFLMTCVLVALAGIGRTIAGIFPCDPGCRMEQMSAAAGVHALAGFIALMSGAVAPLVLAAGLRKSGRGTLYGWSLGIGLASLVLMMLFVLASEAPFIGAIQRLVLALFYGWVVLLSAVLGAFRR